jgi:diguanylate cyclase (GGDEF)-like protein/PAS domain S-box-containing protein
MRWTHRHGGLALPLVGILAAAMVFVASLAVTGARLVHQSQLEENANRVGFWESSQALSEAQRLRAEIYRQHVTRDDGGALRLRLDILWSRLDLLSATGNDGPRLPALETVRAELQRIFDRLREVERLLAPMIAGDPTAFAEASATMDDLVRDIGATHRELNHDRQIMAEATSQGLGRLRTAFAFSALGLVASVTLLSGLLFWQWRRTQRLLTETEGARARADRSERLLRVLVDALPVMVSAHDREGRFVLANNALADFLGQPEDRLVGQRLADVTGQPGDARDVAAALSGGQRLGFREVAACDASGRPRTLLTTTAPVDEAQGRAETAVRISLDITERKEAEQRIRHLAEHDPLTGLANRHVFGEALDAALARGGMVALHLVDLDDFKDVNDSMGHVAGDALLVAAAARMRGSLQPGELLARLGGDEFAVIQTDIRHEAEADRKADSIGHLLSEPEVIEGQLVSARASIGTVIGPVDGMDGQALLQRADIALYRAKAAGKGRAQRYSGAMEAQLVEQRRLQADLDQAIEDGALHFDFQPKFSVRDLRFVGCEALARWTHPVRGVVPPSVFVPLTETARLSTRFALLTLRAALRQRRAWREAGHDIAVAVNLSARHVVSGQAPALLREALAAEGERPEGLEIEVTEDVFIKDSGEAAETLAALQREGVRLALDDFGTGYASLGYLQQLPFDVIKLDRSFVMGLGTSDRTEQIVAAVVRIAHGLGATLVAEGVENAMQLARLRAIGCDDVQGYLLGKPMSPDVLLRLAAESEPEVPRPVARLAGVV